VLQLNFIPFPLLQTPRLLLRNVTPVDAPEIFFLRSDKTVLQFLDRVPITTVAEAAQFIHNSANLQQAGDAITWGLTLKGASQLIGTIAYWRMQKEHYRAEIGYALHPEHHGKGLMQEALTAVLDYGFKVMSLHSVEANVNPCNVASINLLERNGFVREGYFRENYFYDGRFLDSAIYSKLAPAT
jgi:[ribosomal protein S5]-alanine N-acetyltransferase